MDHCSMLMISTTIHVLFGSMSREGSFITRLHFNDMAHDRNTIVTTHLNKCENTCDSIEKMFKITIPESAFVKQQCDQFRGKTMDASTDDYHAIRLEWIKPDTLYY